MGFVPSDASSVLLGVASDLERELRRGAADDGRADAGRAAEPPASSRLPVRRSPPGVVAVLGVDGPEKRNDRRPGDVARDSGREVISPRSPRREVLRPAESPSARTELVRVRSAIGHVPCTHPHGPRALTVGVLQTLLREAWLPEGRSAAGAADAMPCAAPVALPSELSRAPPRSRRARSHFRSLPQPCGAAGRPPCCGCTAVGRSM